MASTATTLRTAPAPAPTALPTAIPNGVPGPTVGRRRGAPVGGGRGNHPAGRALPREAGASAPSVAPVVPLRRPGAVVVPLRRAAPTAALLPAGPAAAAAPVRLRLTRRGRLVLSGLGVVTALGVAFSVAALTGGTGADPALELAGRSSVVVHSGDTLWSIAESVAPGTDPRLVVDALQEANGLSGSGLVPGQVLVLP